MTEFVTNSYIEYQSGFFFIIHLKLDIKIEHWAWSFSL